MPDRKQVTIYTDGSCLNNPGPGGYGAVLLFDPHRREVSGGFRLTTNNRMEMMAVIAALEALKEPCNVILYSDSQYVVNAIIKGWARRWQANDWRRNKKERAVNPDLWERLIKVSQRHEVDFRWLRGHSGIVENERCDRLALAAATRSGLPEDLGYQRNR
ncbi:MAG TPA: ribonuclease HI [Dehalococcoidia bacterium]|nr:ribonuclease HI [Dehalococcoidia bacterium]